MTTHLPLRIWLTISLGLITAACAHTHRSLELKVWRLRAAGLARRMEQLPLDRAQGYYCLSPRDFEALILRAEQDQELP